MNRDLASVTGLLLKACPILRKSVPHALWLEYLHTARFVARRLNTEERDIAARAAGYYTIEEAVKMAEDDEAFNKSLEPTGKHGGPVLCRRQAR